MNQFWNKVRPSALYVATGCGAMTFYFGMKLFGVIEGVVEGDTINESTVALVLALSAVVFTNLGALIALGVQMASDPEPNALLEYLKLKLASRREVNEETE